MTTERLVSIAKNKFPQLDYSDTIFIDSLTKIEFKCPIHGVAKQDPYTHLKSKFGCPKCGADNRIKDRINNRARRLEQDFRSKRGDKIYLSLGHL
jgi:rubredoxin